MIHNILNVPSSFYNQYQSTLTTCKGFMIIGTLLTKNLKHLQDIYGFQQSVCGS